MATRHDGERRSCRTDDFHLYEQILRAADGSEEECKAHTTSAVSLVEPTSTTHAETWEEEDM